MRAPLLLLPLTLALTASLPAAAQDAPRVLFCAGDCFAVDAKGVRTPVRKGSRLSQGQRLETGPGGYAQVKLNDASAVGIGERARIGFERNTVVLDEGRVRMIGGEAFGKVITQPMELRTTDGTLVLRGADVEAKKVGLGATTPTIVKVNAGDARLGDLSLPTQGVQGISRGRLGDVALPITDIAVPARVSETPAAGRPINIASAPFTVPQPPVLRTDRLTPVVELPFRPLPLPPADPVASVKPVLTAGEKLMNRTFNVRDQKTNFAEILADPAKLLTGVTLTGPTVTPTSTISTTISPTLSNTVLQSPTYTFQVAPTLTTSTTTTSVAPSTSTTSLSTSILSSPIVLSPTTTTTTLIRQ